MTEVSMEIQYVTTEGTLTYDGMTLIKDVIEDAEAVPAAGSIDSLSDVTITSAATGQILRYNGTAWVNGSAIVLNTQVSASSQTDIDFTGIPSWVNRVTVMARGLSTNGTSNYVVRVGDGAIVATGYLGATSRVAAGVASTAFTTGCGVATGVGAATTVRFVCTISRQSGNTWVFSGTSAFAAAETLMFASEVTLTGALDRVRVTTANGTDTFDAGSVNISWE